LARAYRDLASFYYALDPHQLPEMVRLVDSASELYGQAGNISQQANCLEFLANLYIAAPADSLARALRTLKHCLEAHNSIHDTRLTRVYLMYGQVYDLWGDYPKALKYKLMALQAAEDEGNTGMTMCEINNGIGIALYNSKEDEKARIYFKHALQVAEKFDDVDNGMEVVNNIVNTYIKSNRPDSALAFIKSLPKQILEPKSEDNFFVLQLCYFKTYTALANYSEAHACYDKLTQMVKGNKAYEGYDQFLYGPLIDLYLATKQYAAAALYIQKEGRLGEPRYRKAACHHQYLLDSAQGHYLEGDLTVINEAGLTILLRFAPFKGKTLQRKAPLEADFA
jgi:tetratricopeptide (TPR) repeat protein